MGKLHIGTMGWSYDFWVGNFYPQGTEAKDFLQEYAKRFDSVEIDSTFYRIPSHNTVEKWRAQTPVGFVFSAKFPQAVTHEKMLVDCGEEVEVFVENMSLLGDRLGALLLQLPYGFKPERFEVLKDFLPTLPEGHRYALEVKNRKWLEEKLYSLLRDNDVALALVDHPWVPEMDTLTADFVYIRWEGDRRKINGKLGRVERDRGEDIRGWAGELKKYLDEGVEVFGYFSKYYSGHPPTDARQLLDLL